VRQLHSCIDDVTIQRRETLGEPESPGRRRRCLLPQVIARVQVPTAVQFCDQPSAATASAVWISDCTTLVTRVDTTDLAATTVGAGASVAAPLVLSGEAWVPIDGRFVHVRDDLSADRAVSVAGQPLVFGGVVAFGSVWANVGFGTIARVPVSDIW
jgi:hypothetical protein